MPLLELMHSVHKKWRDFFKRPDPKPECEVCGDNFWVTNRYRRVRWGAYHDEPAVMDEDVCERCFKHGYGFLYEMKCHDCGSVQTRNQKCDGPYSCYLDCDTCKRKFGVSYKYTRHTRGEHAADTRGDTSP